MQKLKVLFMQSQTYFGSDSMIHSLIMRYLNRNHVEVHVACNKGSEKEKSASLKALENVPDIYLRPTYFGPTLNDISRKEKIVNTLYAAPTAINLLKLAWYIKKNNIDIIHGTEKPRDAFYGLILAKLTGKKCVIHLHVKAENWISPLVRWAMHRADAIIGVSKFVADSAVAMGYRADRVHYVLNSIDASKWDYNLDKESVRKEFGIADSTPLLSIISRLFHWKGHTELIKALSLVKKQTSNFRLLVVGEDDQRGAPGKGSYSQELKALVKELGLEEQVIFTGFRRDVAQILAATDIYTMPSYEEPCAVAYLEAMAMKKPIVALSNGGTVQLVEHGKDGLLSEPKNIEQLAENILTLINNPELRREMGEHARYRVEEYFTPQRMADEIEKIYDGLL